MKSMKRLLMAFAMLAVSASSFAAPDPIHIAPGAAVSGVAWSAPSSVIAEPVQIAPAAATKHALLVASDKGKPMQPSPVRGTLMAMSSGVLAGSVLMFVVTSPGASASVVSIPRTGSEDEARLWVDSAVA